MNTLSTRQTNPSKSQQLLDAFWEGYAKEKDSTVTDRLTDSMFTPLYVALGAGNYFLKELGIVEETPLPAGSDPVLAGVTSYLRGSYEDRIEMLAGPAVELALALAGVKGTINGGIKIGKTAIKLSKLLKKAQTKTTPRGKSMMKPKGKLFDLKPEQSVRELKRLEKGVHSSGGSKKVGPRRN